MTLDGEQSIYSEGRHDLAKEVDIILKKQIDETYGVTNKLIDVYRAIKDDLDD